MGKPLPLTLVAVQIVVACLTLYSMRILFMNLFRENGAVKQLFVVLILQRDSTTMLVVCLSVWPGGVFT